MYTGLFVQHRQQQATSGMLCKTVYWGVPIKISGDGIFGVQPQNTPINFSAISNARDHKESKVLGVHESRKGFGFLIVPGRLFQVHVSGPATKTPDHLF